jgi:hypothetical protein
MILARALLCSLFLGGVCSISRALEKPEITYRIFQFPADAIPRIDGDASDWEVVPDDYVIGIDQFTDDSGRHVAPDASTLDVRVKVGWVAGLDRLYFLYEAYDDCWDFASPGLDQDTFEIMVDGDASGGPFVDKSHTRFWTPERVGEPAAAPDDRISEAEAKWAIHGVHAQNYHVFVPAEEKDWTLAWGAATWIKELPWANAASSFSVRHGEGGRVVVEFWITPFDYAGPEGPQRAVPSVLREDKIIGLSMILIDYDRPAKQRRDGFWTLSPKRTSYGHASELCAFRLMPLEPALRKHPIEARWSWRVVDTSRRLVAFRDETRGTVDAWSWDFGDGVSSTEQHPLHAYEKPGNYVVVLEVAGPEGRSRRSKVWDVQLR